MQQLTTHFTKLKTATCNTLNYLLLPQHINEANPNTLKQPTHKIPKIPKQQPAIHKRVNSLYGTLK